MHVLDNVIQPKLHFPEQHSESMSHLISLLLQDDNDTHFLERGSHEPEQQSPGELQLLFFPEQPQVLPPNNPHKHSREQHTELPLQVSPLDLHNSLCTFDIFLEFNFDRIIRKKLINKNIFKTLDIF